MAISSSSVDAHNKIQQRERNTIDTPTCSCGRVPASSPYLSQNQIYSCPRHLCNLFLLNFLSCCSSFFHFSSPHASSHNSGLLDTSSFSLFQGENKGAVFRGQGQNRRLLHTDAYKDTSVVPLHP